MPVFLVLVVLLVLDISWVLGDLAEMIMWLLIMAAGGALLAGLVLAAPTAVLLRYRERIMAKFCTPYRRPEGKGKEQ